MLVPQEFLDDIALNFRGERDFADGAAVCNAVVGHDAVAQPVTLRRNVLNRRNVFAGFCLDDEFRVVDAGGVFYKLDVQISRRAAANFDDDGRAVCFFDVLDVQNAIDEVQFTCDTFAVVSKLGESRVTCCARRVCPAD